MRHHVVLGLMAMSGFAGLGYQIVWTQQCALWLGHESAAVLAVVAAFFGGLALGALTLGAHVQHSLRPARWYAGCELVIAAWGLALVPLLGPLSHGLLAIVGTQPHPAWQWGVAFFGTFIVLLPATAAMGATLPAMERVAASLGGRNGHRIAGLYASNTLGAVAGVLAAAFWLVPQWGLSHTAMVCAAFNLLCAAIAWQLSGQVGAEPAAMNPNASPGRSVLTVLACTGLLGIGYEVLVVRVLSQVAEDTVYTFAMLLAVYLVGSSLGAAAYTRWSLRDRHRQATRQGLLCAQALACLLGTLFLWASDAARSGVAEVLGPGMGSALASEAAIALLAFGPPTLVMGALFSHLATEAQAAGQGLGRALGINTLGAAAAPCLFGVLLVPAIGPKQALLLVAAGYLALAGWPARRSPVFWSGVAAGLALLVWAPPLAFVDVPEGGQVLRYDEGTMAAVSVVEDAQGVARLRIDNRQQEGSSATRFTDGRQALLPLLLHPSPRNALFLGLGTGVTAASAAEDTTLQVDAVELLPEVIAASPRFTSGFEHGGPNLRLHVMAADARRFVRTEARHYDVIVADNFHPARSGSGALYTVEHFRAVRERLTEDGVFCQWLPLHQLDLDTLRSIVASFLAANPGGWAMLATNSLETPVLGLVARRGESGFDVGAVSDTLARKMQPLVLADFGIEDELALLGNFVAGPRSLARFADGASLNTDDHPVVTYSAPRVTYAPDSLPRDRLSALMAELTIEPRELLAGNPPAVWTHRLSAYWAARNRFIEAGREVRPSADLQQMLSQVRGPLLSVLQISPDFRPAYDPLLRMAAALARSDAAAARVLLRQLKQAQPARPEADQLLNELADASSAVTR